MAFSYSQFREVRQRAIAKQLTAEQINARCRKIAGRGLQASGYEYVNLVKQVLSIPAPRVLFRSKDGSSYYRAGWLVPKKTGSTKTHATKTASFAFRPSRADPGAPPRKLSGTLRMRMTMKYDDANNVVRAGVLNTTEKGKPLKYARRLEREGHPYLKPTLEKNLANLGMVVGRTFTANVSMGAVV
jgi:hypothetical protein